MSQSLYTLASIILLQKLKLSLNYKHYIHENLHIIIITDNALHIELVKGIPL